MSHTILVTGASGKLGRGVIRHLLESQGVPAGRIVAASRDPGKLADLARMGVAVRRADFDDPAGLPTAFAGAGTVLVISTDALDGAGTRLRQQRAAIAAAAGAGAGRIAYTSLPVPETSKVSFAPDHLGTEAAVKATGLPYTIFRDNWYQENLFMSLPRALKSGRLYSAAGQGRIAYVARDDVAAAIAGSLASPPAGSATYTLTGAEAPTVDETAALAARIAGMPIEVIHVNEAELAAGMKAAGVPEGYIQMLVSFDQASRAGDLSAITGDVERLSGRRPRPLSEFLEANLAALTA